MYSFYEFMKKIRIQEPPLSPKIKPIITRLDDKIKKPEKHMKRNESSDSFMKYEWPWIN